jgi:hypothetical protein
LKKQYLPVKYCAVCEKPFNWRKKWKKTGNKLNIAVKDAGETNKK